MIPYSNETTSKDAAVSMSKHAVTLRQEVLEFLTKQGNTGATDEEIQDALDLNGNTERPRRWELVLMGQVVDSGGTRLTDSGRGAIVWKLAQYAAR